MKNKNYSQYLFLVFFAVLFFVFPSSALALSLGGISINPSDENGHRDWFIYNLKPGESIEDYVEVSNGSDKEERVSVRAYDSEPSNIGAFALTGPNKTQKGIGLWVKLEETDVVLVPGDRKKIKFTFTVPENADTGEHSGAITVQTMPRELKGVTGISFGTRVGARVYETVPGQIIKKMKIISFSLQELVERKEFQLDLVGENEGNVSLSPLTRLDIGGWGLISKREIFHNTTFQNYWQLLRGATVSTNWLWPKPYFGKFTFKVTLTYEDENGSVKKLTTEELSRWVIPKRDAMMLGAVLLFLILVALTWIIYRKKKYSGKGWDEYKVKDNDNIMVLAQKCHIPWKFLVKVNRIKKPYFLVPGKTILVPPGSVISKATKGGKEQEKENEPVKRGRRDKMKWVLLMVIVVLTTAALVSAIALFVQSTQKPESAPIVEPTIIPDDKIAFGNKPGAVPEEPSVATSTATITPEEIPLLGVIATTTPVIAPTSTPLVAATTTEPTAQPTPSPFAEATGDKEVKNVRAQVLNGSGIAGYAAKVAKILSDNGYAKTTIGNADSFEHKDLSIAYLDPFKEDAENIQKILLEEYKNIVVAKSEKQEFDVIIILGKK